MSYYYSYYLGYEKNNKIYPLGVFDCNGKLYPVIERSRSFASDLNYEFDVIPKEMRSEELSKHFYYHDKDEIMFNLLKYLPIKSLGSTNYIKSGYFLVKDISAYLKDRTSEEIFYDKLTSFEYLALLKKDIIFNNNPIKTSDDEYEEEKHSWDYEWFSYPDYFCREYEVFLLKEVFESYDYSPIFNDKENEVTPVIILSEG